MIAVDQPSEPGRVVHLAIASLDDITADAVNILAEIDVERGVVVAIVVFQIPGGDYEYELNGQKVMRSYTPRALYLFEAFKISGGVIHQIEATMRNLDHGAKIDWPSN